MKRKIAAIGLTILMMLGVTGCMESYEEKNENMLAHMKEKYGVEFEIQGYIPRNVDCSYDVWYVNRVGDTETIEVHRYYGELAADGEYADEYYSRMMRDEIESRAIEALSEITDEVKVYLSHFSYADEEYREADQLDEYLQTEEGKKAFALLVFIKDRENNGIMNQEVIEHLQEVLLEAGIGKPRARVFFVKTEELMEEIDRESHKEMIYRSGEEKIYTRDYSGNIERGLK